MRLYAVSLTSSFENVTHIEVILANTIEEALLEKLKRHSYQPGIGEDGEVNKNSPMYPKTADEVIKFAWDCDICLNALEIGQEMQNISFPRRVLELNDNILEAVSEPSYKLRTEESQEGEGDDEGEEG